MEIKRIIDEIYINDEYCDVRPDAAKVILTPRLIKRALQLSKAVIKLKVYKIVEFDYRPEWLWLPPENENGEYIPWDGSIDTVMLNVCDDEIRWKGYIKHTGIEVETGPIMLSELLEIKKVLDTPKENLPLLINSLDNDTAKNALQQRLKDE